MRNRKQRAFNEITIFPHHQNIGAGDDVTPPPDPSSRPSARRYACCTVSHSCLRWSIGILALIAALSILPVVIVAYLATDDVVANQRYFIDAPSANMVGSLTGQLQLNYNSRQIVWDFLTFNITLPLQTIHIHGPIATNVPTAPLYVALCGSPSTLQCVLSGVISQTNPDALSLATFISDIRARPFAYYLNVTTAFYPALDARAPLGISSGRQ